MSFTLRWYIEKYFRIIDAIIVSSTFFMQLYFFFNLYIYIYIIIIIIISLYQHGYPWPSLTTPPYRPLLLSGLQGYIPYRLRAVAYKFELARPCEGVHRSTSLTSPSLLLQECLACLVYLILIVSRWVVGGCTAAAFWGVQYCSQHSCVVTVKLFFHTFS